jgi:hypothetical protein
MAASLGPSYLSCYLRCSSARVAVTRGPECGKLKKTPLLEAVVRERLVKTVGWKRFNGYWCDL